MALPDRKVITIEEVRRRRRRLEFIYFGWYFLGSSVTVLGGELVLMLTGTLMFLFFNERFVSFAPISFVAVNLFFSFLLAVTAIDRHNQKQLLRFRTMAWWGHPVCLAFRLARFIFLLPYRIIVWLRTPPVTREQLDAFASAIDRGDTDPAA